MRAYLRAVRDEAFLGLSFSWVDPPAILVGAYAVWLMVLDGVRG